MEIKKTEEKEDKITLIINNEESKITSLIKGIINDFKKVKALEKNSYYYKIKSKNIFPMKSGCASSTSSMSLLVMCI